VTQKIYIIGAGGHGRETLMLLRDLNRSSRRWEFAGFLDGGPGATGALQRLNASVVGPPESLLNEPAPYVIAIGNPVIRKRIAQQLGNFGAVSLVHPDVNVGSKAKFSSGCIVAMGSRVGAESQFGLHTHLNVACVVGSGSEIGSYVSLSPGVFVESDVRIEDGVFLGTRAIVCSGVTIGKGARIGAGSVVKNNVPSGALHVGNPGLIKDSLSLVMEDPQDPRLGLSNDF
jgi:sugar O-acyltransferase (sialic acid O-acetyltransferase NeuD family)